jgi:hypothetical protein
VVEAEAAVAMADTADVVAAAVAKADEVVVVAVAAGASAAVDRVLAAAAAEANRELVTALRRVTMGWKSIVLVCSPYSGIFRKPFKAKRTTKRI